MLTAVFSAVALLVALKMVLPLDKWILATGVPRGTGTLVMPATIGMVSTMMGIGGGSLSVPALTLMNEPIHRAVGTAALFGLLISIPGTLGFIWSGYGNELLPPGSLGYVNLIGFAFIAPATVLAAPLGARLAHALSRRQLSVIFGCFLFIVSLRMLLQTLESLGRTKCHVEGANQVTAARSRYSGFFQAPVSRTSRSLSTASQTST